MSVNVMSLSSNEEDNNANDNDNDQWSNKRAMKVLICTGIGTFLEYYDFGLVGYFQQEISDAFFPPNENENVTLLQSFSLYGIAFLMMPVGGLFFGYIGDKYGRITALRTSIILIAFPTFLIGCTPLYSSLGITSTILIFIFRAIQGMAAGGEGSICFIYVLEEAPINSKTFYFAILWVVGTGEFLALLFHIFLSNVCTKSFLYSFGFRIPFLCGLLIGFAAIYARYSLPYTQEFERMRSNDLILQNPILYAFKHNLKEIIVITLAIAITSMMWSMSLTWLPAYLLDIKHDNYAYNITIANYIIFFIIMLVTCYICDRYSSLYRVIMCGGIIGFFILFITFSWIGWTENMITLSVLQIVSIFGPAMYVIPIVSWCAQYCGDPRVRATIFAFCYNLSVAIFVSTSFDVCTSLQSLDDEYGMMYVATYLCCILLMGLIAIGYGEKNPVQTFFRYSTINDDSDK